MIFKSVTKINRLIFKRMSNIYLKVTIEKALRTPNFDLLSLKSLFLLQLQNQRSGIKIFRKFFIILTLKGIMTF